MRRRLFEIAFTAAAVVALAFLLVPILAIFAHSSPAHVLDQLSNPVVTDAAKVTIKTSVIAQLLILLFGTPAAFVLASRRFPGYSFAVTLVELPLVLPPAVAGIGLLAAFEAIDPNMAAASRTLGAGPARTFFRVVLPLARGGLIAGLALSFARGLGEFGATIMFAGSLQHVTQTLPLAIYAEFDQDFDATLAMSGVLVLVSALLLLTLRIGLVWQRSSSTGSRSLFGLSTSA